MNNSGKIIEDLNSERCYSTLRSCLSLFQELNLDNYQSINLLLRLPLLCYFLNQAQVWPFVYQEQWERSSELGVQIDIFLSELGESLDNDKMLNLLKSRYAFSWSQQSDKVLKQALSLLVTLNTSYFTIENLVCWGEALDRLLRRYFLRELPYWSSPDIAKLLIRLLNAQSNWKIYNPFLVWGQLLVAAGTSHKEIEIYVKEDILSIDSWSQIYACYWGVFCSHLPKDLALGEYSILDRTIPWDGIVSVLPASRRGRTFNEWRLINVLSNTLKPSGKAVFLTTSAVFFRDSDSNIRRSSILNSRLETVIFLPAKLFAKSSAVRVIVIIKNFSLDSNFSPILLINAQDLCENGFNDLVEIYQHRREVEGTSLLLSLNTLESEDFTLSLSRFFSTPLHNNNWRVEWQRLLDLEEKRAKKVEAVDRSFKELVTFFDFSPPL